MDMKSTLEFWHIPIHSMNTNPLLFIEIYTLKEPHLMLALHSDPLDVISSHFVFLVTFTAVGDFIFMEGCAQNTYTTMAGESKLDKNQA